MILAVSPDQKQVQIMPDHLVDEYTSRQVSDNFYEVVRHLQGESWVIGRYFPVSGGWSAATVGGRPRSTFSTMEDAYNWVVGANLTMRRKHFKEDI
jgi:hypothetical protein